MPRLTFRDRFFSPKTARVILAPLSIVLAGVGAAAGMVVAGPLGAVVGGALLYGGRVLTGMPKAGTGPTIDPLALSEPWRNYVGQAMSAQARFHRTVATIQPGPLKDRMLEVAKRVDDSVEESWAIGKRGHEIGQALRELGPTEVYQELLEAQASAKTPEQLRTLQALQSQYDTILRLDAVHTKARDQLRASQERLDELVARAVELKATGATDATALEHDVDAVVDEMEALRQAIEETRNTGGGGLTQTA